MNGEILRPVIPETVTVHLGRPDAPARNVTVPFADYIKNEVLADSFVCGEADTVLDVNGVEVKVKVSRA